jgi:two-component system NarL family sensor kinase
VPRREPAEHVRRSPLRRELVVFLSVALLTLVAVGAGTIFISGRVARDTALDEAEQTGVRMARVLVEPLLAQTLAGDRETLDRLLFDRLEDGSVTTVSVWTPDGQVVYSSDRLLEGRSVAPSAELAAAGGELVSDLDSAPELGRPAVIDGPFLEIYAPMTVNGEPLVLQAYFSSSAIDRNASLLRSRVVPLAIGALVALQLVQGPIAVSLGRRLRREEVERRQLIERNVRAAEREQAVVRAQHLGLLEPVHDQ